MPEEIPQESERSDLKNPQGPTLETKKPSEAAGNSLSQIRTYQGDIASALNNQKESIVSIQQTEVAKRRATGNQGAPEEHTGRQRAILLTVGAIVLVVLAIFGGWYTYREYVVRSSPPTTIIPESRFISSAQEESLGIATTTNRSEFIKSLRDASVDVPKDEVKNVVLRKGTDTNPDLLSVENFLRILESNAPSSLVRSFNPIFMFGSLGGESVSNFIIIKLASFENAYAGMLEWEGNIASDIGPIFPSAERLKNVISLTDFQDVTDKNKDARVLYDPEGKEVLLYSFLNNDILIITDNINTLHTIISRLTAESLVR